MSHAPLEEIHIPDESIATGVLSYSVFYSSLHLTES